MELKRRDFERQWGFGRPQTGSALHHLVTSVSVKKALMDFVDFGFDLKARGSLRHAPAIAPIGRVK